MEQKKKLAELLFFELLCRTNVNRRINFLFLSILFPFSSFYFLENKKEEKKSTEANISK